MTVEIRAFDGDPEALSDFVAAGWRAINATSGFVPVWSADYFRWQLPSLAAGRTDGIVAAYEGRRLIGVFPAEVVPIQIRGEPAIATMASWLTVDPEYLLTGVGRALLQGMRRFNEQVGGIFTGGFVNQGTIAGSGRGFWAASAGRATMFERPRMWARVLDWRTLCGALWSRLDRVQAFMGANVSELLPAPAASRAVRAYRPPDLDSCHAIFDGHMRAFDLQYCWDKDRLGHHLGFGRPSRSLVLDASDGVEGYVNFHILDALGRKPFRLGIVDGLAPADLPLAKAAALLETVVATMQDEKVALITLLGPPVHRRSLLLRCGFLPMPSTYKLLCIEMKDCPPLAGLRRIYTHLR